MKKVHELALKQVVVDQEGLQKAWNNPGVVPMLANREALVTLVVAKDKDGFYYWNVAIRIRRKDKKLVKKTALWTASDTYAARKILYGMIQDVGDSTTEEEFPSQWALHVQRRLRAEERDFLLRDDILGKAKEETDGSLRGQHEGQVLENDDVSHDSGHDGGTTGDGGQDRSEEEVDPEAGHEPGTL